MIIRRPRESGDAVHVGRSRARSRILLLAGAALGALLSTAPVRRLLRVRARAGRRVEPGRRRQSPGRRGSGERRTAFRDGEHVARAGSVLVTYASRHGSTRGVAERIVTRLREEGGRVDWRPVEQLRDLRRYDAFVIGSPVYDGSWLPEALAFARRQAPLLAGRPVWLFSVGALGDRHPLAGRLVRHEPRELHELRALLRPRDYRVFAGAIDPRRWSLGGRVLLRLLGGSAGDRRDWREIDTWAATIARQLRRLEGRDRDR